MQTDSGLFDVTVVGGGLAGTAASHSSREGWIQGSVHRSRVDPSNPGRRIAGLVRAGIVKRTGIADGGTYPGRNRDLQTPCNSETARRAEQHYVLPIGLPSRLQRELATIHVDRSRLSQSIREIFLASGATLLADKVVRVVRDGDRVSSLHTEKGTEILSRWYIDASGSNARPVSRAFNLPSYDFGPPKSRYGITSPCQSLLKAPR